MQIRTFLSLTLLFAGMAGTAMAASGTSSVDCVHQIRNAVNSGNTAGVIRQCWSIGPIALGMSRAETTAVLKQPDKTFTRTIPSKNLEYALYAFPRDLQTSLKRAPTSEEQFAPVTLEVIYENGRVVSISVGIAFANSMVRCGGPSHNTGSLVTTDSERKAFPYKFASVGLGDPLTEVKRKFGPFKDINTTQDEFRYWDVPIEVGAVDGSSGSIDRIEIATGMDVAGLTILPRYRLLTNPKTCLVTGYEILNY